MTNSAALKSDDQASAANALAILSPYTMHFSDRASEILDIAQRMQQIDTVEGAYQIDRFVWAMDRKHGALATGVCNCATAWNDHCIHTYTTAARDWCTIGQIHFALLAAGRNRSRPAEAVPAPDFATQGWDWLDQDDKGAQDASNVVPLKQRLSYVLSPDLDSYGLILSASYDDGRPLAGLLRFAAQKEHILVRNILALPRADIAGSFRLTGEQGRHVLESLMDDFNAVDTAGNQILRGEEIQSLDKWHVANDGCQQFLVTDRPVTLFDVDGPIALENGLISPVKSVFPAATLIKLVNSGPLPPERSSHAKARLGSIAPEAAPSAIAIERIKMKPEARITFDRVNGTPVVQVEACYDGVPVDNVSNVNEARHFDPEAGLLRIFERDREDERRIKEDAINEGLQPTSDPKTFKMSDDGSDEHAALFKDRIGRSQGKRAWVERDGPNWNIRIKRVKHLDLALNPGDAYHEFTLDVMGDDKEINFIVPLAELAGALPITADQVEAEELLTPIITKISRDGKAALTGEDGTIWLLPADQLSFLVLSLRRILLQPNNGRSKVQLDAYSVAELNEVSDLLPTHSHETAMKLVDLFKESEAKPAPWPACFTGTRVDDQNIAMSWMRALYDAGYGGILGDGTGFGKSVELLLHIASLWEAGELKNGALIAVPNTSMGKWLEEIKKNFASLPHMEWHADSHEELPDGPMLVMVKHSKFQRDKRLAEKQWTFFAFDEAQDMRNPKSHMYMAAANLPADQKIPTTATPVENSLLDMWSLMNIANPGLLGSAKTFGTVIRIPVEKQGDVIAASKVHRFVKPFLLAREDKSIPMHNMTTILIEPTYAQKVDYNFHIEVASEEIRKKLAKLKNGLAGAGHSVMTSLIRVRQLCCHPALVPGAQHSIEVMNQISPKTQAIVQHARQYVDQGKRILAFSQWVGHLEHVALALGNAGIRVAFIHGQVSLKERKEAEDLFKAHKVDMLLITGKTGGRALDFNEADAVFLLDPWWNPKVDEQAIGRAKRRGQTKVIDVLRFLIAGSVEEKILQKFHTKKESLANIFSPDAFMGEAMTLTQEDIDTLLTRFEMDDEPLRRAA